MFRRARFTEVIASQLDLFVSGHRDVLDEADARLDAYNAADRDEIRLRRQEPRSA